MTVGEIAAVDLVATKVIDVGESEAIEIGMERHRLEEGPPRLARDVETSQQATVELSAHERQRVGWNRVVEHDAGARWQRHNISQRLHHAGPFEIHDDPEAGKNGRSGRIESSLAQGRQWRHRREIA